ncbi:hypothetical protein [Actinorugispora endophytica]|nr:hypothetical protein [Actinorugispora endophytica]
MGSMVKRGHWRESDGSPMKTADARDIWAEEAYSLLVDVARTYHAVITYKELAEKVQKTSGIRTSALLRNWIGAVLGVVVREAHRRGDPPLTALVVHSDDGMVGEGYKEVLWVAGEPPLEDVFEREHHAAEARLACYRRFGATLPPDGGTAALAPRLQATVERRRRAGPRAAGRCPFLPVILTFSGSQRRLRPRKGQDHREERTSWTQAPRTGPVTCVHGRPVVRAATGFGPV